MRIASWRGILFAGTIGLLIIYAVWWGRMIGNPAERSGADFIAFYSAGRVAQAHGLASMYHIEYQREIEQEVVGFPLAAQQVLLYNHMPYLVPILALVVDRDYAGSFIRWVLILMSLYVAGTYSFVKSLLAGHKDKQFALIAGMLTFFPIFISLWQGQDTAFLYVGVVLWCVGLLKKQDWLIAAGLALATVRPHLSIVLAVPLLLKYRRAWWRSLLLIGVLALVSLMILRAQGTGEFLNVLGISSEGKWFGMKPEAMLNLLGFLIRIVQLDSQAASWIGWLIYFIGIALIGRLWWHPAEINGRQLGLTLLIALITAPHLHLHDLSLLIFPILFIVRERLTTSSELRWMLFPLGASLFLLVGLLLDEVYFILPYVLFVVVGWMLLDHERGMLVSENQET